MRLALVDEGLACERLLRAGLDQSHFEVSNFARLRSPAEVREHFEQLKPDLLFVERSSAERQDPHWLANLHRLDKSLPIFTVAVGPGATPQSGESPTILLDDPDTVLRALTLARSAGEARRDLRLTRAKLALAEQVADIGSWEWHVATGQSHWSRRNRAMFGLAEDDASRDSVERWLEAIHPDDRARAMAAVEAALDQSDWLDEELRVNRARAGEAARYTLVRAYGRVIRDTAGAPTAMVGVHQDLAEQAEIRRQAVVSLDLQTRLDSARGQFATLFDGSVDCLAFLIPDERGRLVYAAVNAAGMTHVPCSWDDARGRAPEDVLDGDGGAVIQAHLQHVFETGETFRYEPTFEMNGRRIDFDAVYSPVLAPDGSVSGVMLSARDVTEQRRLERSLRGAQKMEALGQLSSGVAHDFNNVLASTAACLHMLGKSISDDAALAVLAEGQDTIARGRALTQRLLSFARKGPPGTLTADVDQCIAAVVPLVMRTLGGGITVVGRTESEGAKIAADPREIELALINLAVNARDAMPLGGTLTLASERVVLDPGNLQGLAAGRYVVLSASDTGCGMTSEQVARAAEPFFTTKAEGVGTGLGLSIIAKFVHELGGELSIASSLGEGTQVSLILPEAAVDEDAAA